MRLPADGREFAHYTIQVPTEQGTPDAADVEILGEWFGLELVSETVAGANTNSVWRVLVAGPDADPMGSVVLPLRTTATRVRVEQGDESVIRLGGQITVT